MFRTLTKTLLGLAAFSLAFSGHASGQPRIALVIGNGSYTSDPLSDPPRDADLIGEKLDTLGFDVTKRQNLERTPMRQIIRTFGNQLKERKEAVGLFFYSGHGVQVEGRNYMIPIGADIEDKVDVTDEAVGIDYVLSRMDSVKNLLNLVILDACRNNPYEKSFKALESPVKGLNKMDAPRGSLIAFAAEPHKTALQGDGDYSIFTEALADAIGTPNVQIEQMLKDVRKKVYEKTDEQQLPTVDNRLLSEFYFNRTDFILSRDVLTDPKTELMWTRKDNGGDINWSQANGYCDTLTLAGYSDWRLPTVDEFSGIYDANNIGEGFQLKTTGFWSSTKSGLASAWYFVFLGKRHRFLLEVDFYGRALCVHRSGESGG